MISSHLSRTINAKYGLCCFFFCFVYTPSDELWTSLLISKNFSTKNIFLLFFFKLFKNTLNFSLNFPNFLAQFERSSTRIFSKTFSSFIYSYFLLIICLISDLVMYFIVGLHLKSATI